jgi:hypothetical protein
MDARKNHSPHTPCARPGRCRFLVPSCRLGLLAAFLLVTMGARQRSANFIIETPDPVFARQVAQTAEKFRHDLAIEWIGKAMPNWSQPCVMEVQVGAHLGAGGATTFVFDRGEVFNWRMSIQGSPQRILDSVLPHEITHMVYASHFRQPLPRWADEGGATSVEDASERNKHRQMLDQFLRTGRGIAFSQMFAMTEYPRDIMPLYAQGYSLAEFLIQTGGRRKYIEFLGDGLQGDDWSGAIHRNYGIQDLGMLQTTWLAWVRQGSPQIAPHTPQPALIAANERRPRPEPNLIYRIRDKQSPATPMADLVPVRLASSERSRLAWGNVKPSKNLGEGQGVRAANVAAATPPRQTTPAANWIDPSRAISPPAERIALADGNRNGTPVPAVAGWHAPGESASETAAPPAPTQVAHPQPLERPRQTVLE